MNNQIILVFEDQLLGNNPILVRSICLMWNYNILDLLFIPHEDKVLIKFKAIANKDNDFLSKNSIAQILKKEFEKLKLNIKLACNLSIIDDQKPQTGSFSVIIDNQNYAIRVSFHPTNYGESVCFRLIKANIFDSIEDISSEITKGLNIIGGRTCSGKTTLMYSAITKFQGHVITLEDPVEILLKNVSQTDVSIMGYEDGIKSALRQSPDLICIGEIRDKISAQAAIKAALTGHAVLATIHISSPSNLLNRLEELGCNFTKDVLSNVFFMEDFKCTRVNYPALNDLNSY